MPQELDVLEQPGRGAALPDQMQRDRQLAGLGTGHPRLVGHAPGAEAVDDEVVPPAMQPVPALRAAQRAADHRVVPVHRPPALVHEALRMVAQGVVQGAGSRLPAGHRLAERGGETEPAAQTVQGAGASGEQRFGVGGAVRRAGPPDLAAGGLQAHDEVERGTYDRPHPPQEGTVAGGEPAVPGRGRHVGALVAVGEVVLDLTGDVAGRP